MQAYLCEFIGTAMLVLLGDGVCMSATLNKSGFKGSNSVYITIGWGLAVMVPAFMFGYSGASFNPVLTIALAVVGNFAWAQVPGYIVAQISHNP
jgi:glycerol uptake facilitator protein